MAAKVIHPALWTEIPAAQSASTAALPAASVLGSLTKVPATTRAPSRWARRAALESLREDRELLVPRSFREGVCDAFEQSFRHGVEQGFLARVVTVEGAGLHVEGGSEFAHGEPVESFGVEERQGSVHHVGFP